jgi:RTX calcium-binding nonapeptide repeat (4 copies)
VGDVGVTRPPGGSSVVFMDGTVGRLIRRSSFGPLAVATCAAFVLASAPTAAAQESLAASCEPTLNLYEGQTGDRLLAQPFSSQLSGNLTRAELELRDLSGSGDWIVQIRSAQPSGTFPGELEPTAVVLASATLPDASVPEGDSLQSVVFANPAAVVTGGSYAMSITRPAATDPNSLAVGAHTPSTECLHRSYYSTNGGTSWTSLGSDLIFRVFVAPPVVTVTPPLAGVSPASCKGQPATIVGTSNNDVLLGTPGRDVITALGGGDTVSGDAGNDLVCGGPGRDKLSGGPGNDKLFGQGGKDKLKGGKANDVCKGGKGDDSASQCEVEKSI